MATPYLGEIRLFACSFAPKNWALCNGQLLSIASYGALYTLLGTTYGGNGQTTFALPDLRGRAGMHVGGGYTQGQAGGEAGHVIALAELPAHSHQVNAATTATIAGGNGALLGALPDLYLPPSGVAPTEPVTLGQTGVTGQSQAHENRQPYLVLNYCIALIGVFPTRS
jgi:microcystin-dependent protein